MARKQWIFIAPVALVLGGLGGRLVVPISTNGASQIIASPEVKVVAGELGMHLYAPTWLPYEGRPGVLGVRRGTHRILQDYSDAEGRSLCILAQEPRSQRRDAYHRKLFQTAPEATAMVGETTGYFVTGSNGERRLFWNRPEMALILSSSILSDPELVRIAEGIR